MLVIGTETAVFDPGSPVRARILAYTKYFGETHLIVMCRGRYETETIGHVTLHPTNSPSRLLYGMQALLIAARVRRPDVVTAQDPHDCGMIALWIARLKGSRLHVQVHTDVFALSYRVHSFLNRIRSWMAAFVLRRADGIRSVSADVKTSIEARLTPKRPIVVLPIFVDVQHFARAAPGSLTEKFSAFPQKVLWVGRFEPEKRADLAIEAFAAAAPQRACLILLGSGSEEEALRALAIEHGVVDRVYFVGRQDPTPYYALASLVLVTSEYEGYGRVIIEALAAGKPVLAREVGIARAVGAQIAEANFADALAAWFKDGPRESYLANYPYRNFDDYVRQYCDDIVRTLTA